MDAAMDAADSNPFSAVRAAQRGIRKFLPLDDPLRVLGEQPAAVSKRDPAATFNGKSHVAGRLFI
jgi:hypothetical protein